MEVSGQPYPSGGVLERILGTRWEGLDWIHLVEVRVCWQVLVNTITNLQVP